MDAVIGNVVFYGGVLAAKATAAAVRLAARLTAHLLPPATSVRQALAAAVLGGGAWALLLGGLALRSGVPSLAIIGAVGAAAVGGCIGAALFERGRAQAAVHGGAVHFGERAGRLGLRRPHVVARATRVRHVMVTGPTGSGKSTVIKNLVLQDARAPGRPGIMVIDVKDDLVLDIAAHLPPARRRDVLLFDPADTTFPPAFNPLAAVPPEGHTLAAAEVISALKRLFADAWGVRLEHILRQAVLALLETPDATLLDIGRLLTDPGYRAWATGHVTNFAVAQFWAREFPAIVGSRGALGPVEPILNKLSILGSYREVRNVLGRTERGLDLRAAMDGGQIVLAHLPQGALGEDIAFFLAALLVGKVQLAAQSRVNLPQHDRRTFYLYADEFQNYTTSAFDKLVTEGRSLGVGLVVANQYREQLSPSMRLALEKNCAVALTCGLVRGTHTVAVTKLQEPTAPDGYALVRPLPPPAAAVVGQRDAIRAQARARLGQPVAVVEAMIAHRMAAPGPGPAAGVSGRGPAPGAPHPRTGRRRPRATDSMIWDEEAGDGRVFD